MYIKALSLSTAYSSSSEDHAWPSSDSLSCFKALATFASGLGEFVSIFKIQNQYILY